MSQIPELDKSRETQAFTKSKGRELSGQVIYQNPNSDVSAKEEAASQLERLIVPWDLKEPQKAAKYGQIPADYLLIFPIRKDEVTDEELHPLLNKMKGRMHYVCAQKLGFEHGIIFTPTCYYPEEEALLVKVEPEETVVATNSFLSTSKLW